MGVVKRSVAFDEQVLRQAVEIAGERGFSRFVNDLVSQRLQSIRIDAYVAELETQNGPIPDEVRLQAEADMEAAWTQLDELGRRQPLSSTPAP